MQNRSFAGLQRVGPRGGFRRSLADAVQVIGVAAGLSLVSGCFSASGVGKPPSGRADFALASKDRDLGLIFGGDDLAGENTSDDLGTDPSSEPDLSGPPAVVDLGPDPCLERAKLIYTIDQDNTLRSFSPSMLSFTVIGVIHCPAQIGATPFSMGVDKNAVAWVLYSSGEVFHVDTQTAQCSKTNFAANQNGFSTFGMGFVADAKGAHAEHLYVADTGLSQLGVMDPAKLVLQAVGGLNGTPELTGTGDATLWGFFPDVTLPHVAQLDKLTAKEGTTFQLNSLAGTPTAWAFAFWGGDFWIFLKRDLDTSTHVYHLTPANGMVVDAVPNTGFSIVGAGVSICAPTGPTNH